nr:Taste receptor type 1 member 1 like [Ipomoea batatas]GMD32027.1 Taste receptor type 1 member 1 like [Ipomoea batatas]
MAGRANNLLASVFTPPPPKPKFAGISTRRVSFLHNRTCFSIATKAPTIPRKICLQIRRSSLTTPSSQDPVLEEDSSSERSDEDGGGENGGDDGEGWSWTLSFLLFGFWAGLMYYVLILAPNQTPSTDLYFLKKLLNLKGDDGFRMNDVLVAEWYIMGLWPLVYSMLLLPTARTPKCSVPVWPFLVLSCIGGAYALFPFFILWKPPPPPVEETELRRWPLNFLESKLTAGILLASGLGLIVYAGISTGDWKEFYQYFRQSRFIHAMSIDFVLLSAFAPFWVFNDMTTRKWYNKGSWLLPVSAFPFLGPALYLLLRPPVPAVQASSSPSSLEEE